MTAVKIKDLSIRLNKFQLLLHVIQFSDGNRLQI